MRALNSCSPLAASGPSERSSGHSPEGEKDAEAQLRARLGLLARWPLHLQPAGGCCQVEVLTRKQGRAFDLASGCGFSSRCQYVPGNSCRVRPGLLPQRGLQRSEEGGRASVVQRGTGWLIEKALKPFTGLGLEFLQETYLLSCLKMG